MVPGVRRTTYLCPGGRLVGRRPVDWGNPPACAFGREPAKHHALLPEGLKDSDSYGPSPACCACMSSEGGGRSGHDPSSEQDGSRAVAIIANCWLGAEINVVIVDVVSNL